MRLYELPEPLITPEAIAFSPDGRLLAAVDRGRVFVIDTIAGTARTLWPEQDNPYPRDSSVAFTADGRGVIVFHDLSPRAAVEVHDVDTGAVVRDLAMNRYERCEPGPGGRLVYVAAKPRPGWAIVEIVRWNPLTGEKLPPFANHAGSIQHFAVSADEKWLAGSSGDEIRLWNLGGKKLPSRATRQITLERALIASLAIAADGAYLAVGSWLGMGGTVHVGETKSGELLQIAARERDQCRDLAFHPSRPVLTLRGEPGEVAFYDAASRTELRRYAWPLGKITATAFSPDGLRCAAAGTGKVVVWDVDV